MGGETKKKPKHIKKVHLTNFQAGDPVLCSLDMGVWWPGVALNMEDYGKISIKFFNEDGIIQANQEHVANFTTDSPLIVSSIEILKRKKRYDLMEKYEIDCSLAKLKDSKEGNYSQKRDRDKCESKDREDTERSDKEKGRKHKNDTNENETRNEERDRKRKNDTDKNERRNEERGRKRKKDTDDNERRNEERCRKRKKDTDNERRNEERCRKRKNDTDGSKRRNKRGRKRKNDTDKNKKRNEERGRKQKNDTDQNERKNEEVTNNQMNDTDENERKDKEVTKNQTNDTVEDERKDKEVTKNQTNDTDENERKDKEVTKNQTNDTDEDERKDKLITKNQTNDTDEDERKDKEVTKNQTNDTDENERKDKEVTKNQTNDTVEDERKDKEVTKNQTNDTDENERKDKEVTKNQTNDTDEDERKDKLITKNQTNDTDEDERKDKEVTKNQTNDTDENERKDKEITKNQTNDTDEDERKDKEVTNNQTNDTDEDEGKDKEITKNQTNDTDEDERKDKEITKNQTNDTDKDERKDKEITKNQTNDTDEDERKDKEVTKNQTNDTDESERKDKEITKNQTNDTDGNERKDKEITKNQTNDTDENKRKDKEITKNQTNDTDESERRNKERCRKCKNNTDENNRKNEERCRKRKNDTDGSKRRNEERGRKRKNDTDENERKVKQVTKNQTNDTDESERRNNERCRKCKNDTDGSKRRNEERGRKRKNDTDKNERRIEEKGRKQKNDTDKNERENEEVTNNQTNDTDENERKDKELVKNQTNDTDENEKKDKQVTKNQTKDTDENERKDKQVTKNQTNDTDENEKKDKQVTKNQMKDTHENERKDKEVTNNQTNDTDEDERKDKEVTKNQTNDTDEDERKDKEVTNNQTNDTDGNKRKDKEITKNQTNDTDESEREVKEITKNQTNNTHENERKDKEITKNQTNDTDEDERKDKEVTNNQTNDTDENERKVKQVTKNQTKDTDENERKENEKERKERDLQKDCIVGKGNGRRQKKNVLQQIQDYDNLIESDIDFTSGSEYVPSGGEYDTDENERRDKVGGKNQKNDIDENERKDTDGNGCIVGNGNGRRNALQQIHEYNNLIGSKSDVDYTSGSEYVPDSDDSSDSDISYIIPVTSESSPNLIKSSSSEVIVSGCRESLNGDSSSEVSEIQSPEKFSCILPNSKRVEEASNSKMYIRKLLKSTYTRMGKHKVKDTVYNQVHACLYCKKVLTNISKHLKRVHRKEKEVSEILSLDAVQNSKIKKAKWDLLRNLGDHEHNMGCMKHSQGEMILGRRPDGSFSIDDYGPCPSCFQWMKLDKTMQRHQSVCPSYILEGSRLNKNQSKSDLRIRSSIISGKVNEAASKLLLTEVFPIMTNDEITKVATNDKIIISLGNVWLQRNIGNLLKRKYYASARMRQAARLLINLRQVSGQKCDSIGHFLKPEFFDQVVRASLMTASKDFDDDDELKSPSTAIKLGYDLKKMLNCKWAMALRKGADKEKEESKQFLKLMSIEWSTSVTKLATVSLQMRNFNKEKSLANPDDLIKLQNYIKTELKHFKNTDETLTNYRKAVKLTQTRLLLYNKRRSGELESMRIKDYVNRQKTVSDVERSMRSELTELELKLLETQELIEIRGKLGRGVPVIVPRDVIKVLEFISNSEFRKKIGILDENRFIFANTCLGAIRAYDSLKECCNDVKLKKPEKITSVNLRKYAATVSQVFDLSHQQHQWLTNHLGHSMRVHQIHYRETSGLIERIDISKMMLMMEYGVVGKYCGKRLQDIQLQELARGSNTEPCEGEGISGEPVNLDEDENIYEIDQFNFDEVDKEDDAEEQEDDTPRKKKPKVQRMKWSEKEVDILKREFKENLRTRTCPAKNSCFKVLSKLPGRNWENVKKKVWNLIKNQD